VLVRDIELVSGLKSRVASARQTVGWRQFDITTVGITFGLTLTLGVYAYFAGMPMDGSELLFVLVVSWGLVVALRAVLARFKRAGAEEWPQ